MSVTQWLRKLEALRRPWTEMATHDTAKWRGLAKIAMTNVPGLEVRPEFFEGCRDFFNNLFRTEMSFGVQGKLDILANDAGDHQKFVPKMLPLARHNLRPNTARCFDDLVVDIIGPLSVVM